MVTVGYHASHEQFTPGDLLRYAVAAEQAGFTAAMCSDHFAPWSESQGESGFAWSWLGAALQATSLPFGVVNAPGDRYHPAIIAQAAATLASMFPDRFWVALGTGQALNEHITGRPWPPKAERQERLLECAQIMRRLWAGEAVTHHGHVTVHEAQLWTRPERAPMIFGTALTPETAAWVGSWADGLITVNAPPEKLRGIFDAFRAGGGTGKPIALQVHLSWADTDDEARTNAFNNWRFTTASPAVQQELHHPILFEEAAQFVRPDHMDQFVRISSDPARHLQWMREDIELGVEHFYLHNVGLNQPEFIEVFGQHVVPALTRVQPQP
ncbi:MAG TPA: TIGR03885 family FMN-dependent LLM class oxidoreductase [Thermomicrobiales bacterium]|jgi:probable non-F420 flavinoid oxidoreductase|nr:TIGR03885 family FMN-dependent LLM class oxidoreductase [Thermomicrobiales bacterium]